MKSITTFILFILLLPWAAGAVETPTNLDRIEHLFNDMLTSAFRDLANKDSVDILVGAQNIEFPYQWVVEKQMISVARNNGFVNVFFEPQQTEHHCFYRIEYRPISLHITYRHKNGLPKKFLERCVKASLFIKISDGTNRILKAVTVSDSLKDSIRTKEVGRIENAMYPFTIGEEKKARSFRVFLEPLLVTVVTGGIIYSFYTFRSK